MATLQAPSVPHLSGIFLSLYSGDISKNATEWDREFQAMKEVGIDFVGVRAALVGSSSAIAGGCSLGTYTAYYPTQLTPTGCYKVDATGGSALGYLLDGAAAHGVKVHIAPVMPHTPFAWPPPTSKTVSKGSSATQSLARCHLCSLRQ